MIQETRGLRRELFAEFRGAIINGVVGLRAPMLVELIILVGHLPFFLGQFPPLPIFAWKRISIDTADGRICSPSPHWLSKRTSFKSDSVEDVCMAEISEVCMGEVSEVCMAVW